MVEDFAFVDLTLFFTVHALSALGHHALPLRKTALFDTAKAIEHPRAMTFHQAEMNADFRRYVTMFSQSAPRNSFLRQSPALKKLWNRGAFLTSITERPVRRGMSRL